MTIITASDARDEAADLRPEDQHQAEALEAERAKATAGPAVRADGGETREDLPPVDVGDHVEDRDDPDATMVVANLDTLQADAYELESGPTVADVNPEYPATDDVVEVVFPQRTDVTLEPLKKYAYPRERLEIVARVHNRDGGEE